MKKIFILFCCAAALVTGLTACQQEIKEPEKIVDLRYRAQDSYDLPATGAKAFTIPNRGICVHKVVDLWLTLLGVMR